MNEAAVKLARRVNRAAGTLAKRSQVFGRPTKLARKVKRFWATLNHRERGSLTRRWRTLAPHQPFIAKEA